MSQLNFKIYTSDIHNTKWLSIRPFSCHFSKFELPEFKRKYCANGYDSLGKFVTSLRSGEYIEKKFYSPIETQYVYLNVGNFSKGDIDFNVPVFLDDEIGKNYESIKADAGDLIITRSGTVGNVAIFEIPEKLQDKYFIPSHHLAVIKTSTPDEILFLKYYLTYDFCRNFFNAFSTGKVQKEITNWSIRKISIPKKLDKVKLETAFRTIDEQIRTKRKEVISLQESIDTVFSKFGLKSKAMSAYRSEMLRTDLFHIGKSKALRIGAKYNDFWLNHKGCLFEGTDGSIDLLPLKRIVKLDDKVILEKGSLDKPRILIDFEQVESPNGKIIDFENVVADLGSDRIEFGDCDFLTNKLRPYLGYTILNDHELDLIGTTEFIAFNIRDKKKAMREYIRYLLLSAEYLEKSKFLMSGKQHPRIMPIDILNVKVPLPKYSLQEQIVEKIHDLEVKSQNTRNEIKNLRQQIDDLITNELLVIM